MPAYLKHEFTRGFIVGEEHLRRCVQIVANRISGSEPRPSVALKIVRADSLTYTTSEVDEIIREENTGGLAITDVSLTAHCEQLSFDLAFSEDGAYLHVEGERRDDVFLLASEIRQYLEAAVLTRWTLKRDSKILIRLVLAMVSAIGAFLILITSLPAPDPVALKAAIANTDIASKINFLLEKQALVGSPVLLAGAMALSMLLIVFGGDAVVRLWAWLYPVNQFAIGKNVQRLEQRASLREKIFWGGFLAIILGFGVEFAADYFKHQ